MNDSRARFELFDHTADIGVRVFAPTMAGLVQPAAEGLYAVIGEIAQGPPAAPLDFALAPPGRPGAALLLRDLLAELLMLFESEQRIATTITVSRFDERQLTARADTALVDAPGSVYHREAKAVTYHELEIRATDAGYEATFIVDI